MLALLPASALADTGNRIIVKRESGLSAAERRDIRADAGVRYVEALSLPRTEVVVAAPGDVRDAVHDLNADPNVVYAEPARPRRPAAPDPRLVELWAFENTGQSVPGFGRGTPDADMDVIEAWASSTGAGLTVAVVDTGIERTHPDLAGQVFGGYDFLDKDPDPSDPDGHGTHVAGTIAAARDNGEGVAGVAPDAILVPLRALGDGATAVETAAAFDWAGDHGIRIVNASLAGDDASTTERAAMAAHPQTLYVVAAGNDSDNVDSGDSAYPCAYDLANVICVGASDPKDAPAVFSNFGTTSVDVFAPGVGIGSTAHGGYAISGGTSMATPHVTGAAALVLARNRALSVTAIKAAILSRGDAKASMTAKSVTGRRANANHSVVAVPARQTAAPPFVSDLDGDGVGDTRDNCIEWGNADQLDGDGDGAGDACDDRDGDGVIDAVDNCAATANPEQADVDEDEIGDDCIDDRDGDGVLTAADNCPTVTNADQANNDANPAGDACDDRDFDDVVDAYDNCVAVANIDQADQDGVGDGDACAADRDGDSLENGSDNCASIPNGDQADGDGDGVGDACDDRDGDDVADDFDNCVAVANADQTDGNDNDAGDVCDDRDGDGEFDATDNCVAAANAGQADQDGDGVGDACDGDRDGDGFPNGPDNCDSVPNNQLDTDGDGSGDACDPTPRGHDNDGDGRPSVDDACPDAHGTLPNGCPAPSPAPADSDGDRRADGEDACPFEAAVSANGCRVAQVASLSARAKKRGRKRSARIRVTATRAATLSVTVERRKRGRWVRVARRTVVGTGSSFTVSRLKRGAHRVRVTVSSGAGTGSAVAKSFRVR